MCAISQALHSGGSFQNRPRIVHINNRVQILTVCFGKRLQIKFLLHQLRIFKFNIIVFGLVRSPFKTFGEAETPQSDAN